MIRSTTVDQMSVAVYESNAALGLAAARDFAAVVKRTIAEQGEAAVILATGNSQLSFIHALPDQTDIAWNKVSVFHMDEYAGMADTHPASFRRFMIDKVDKVVHPCAFYGITGDAPDLEAEMARYTALLEAHRPVVCVLGIGENGHLAFNDPPADFTTAKLIHVVTLDETCRRQQVGEGHFATFDDVPRHALSLTVPALLRPPHVMALVPESRKASAVKMALEGTVTEMCPASLLRTQAHVKLYLDPDSAALLDLPSPSNSS
jgi:glucosamine-6-phosphate deaminase